MPIFIVMALAAAYFATRSSGAAPAPVVSNVNPATEGAALAHAAASGNAIFPYVPQGGRPHIDFPPFQDQSGSSAHITIPADAMTAMMLKQWATLTQAQRDFWLMKTAENPAFSPGGQYASVMQYVTG